MASEPNGISRKGWFLLAVGVILAPVAYSIGMNWWRIFTTSSLVGLDFAPWLNNSLSILIEVIGLGVLAAMFIVPMTMFIRRRPFFLAASLTIAIAILAFFPNLLGGMKHGSFLTTGLMLGTLTIFLFAAWIVGVGVNRALQAKVDEY